MNALFPQYKLHHTSNSDAYPVVDFLQFSKSKSGIENPFSMIVPCWLICGFFFFSRDNATDAQVCSGLGSCLCGDCVCKKTGVSVMSQYKKDRAACWKIWKKNVRGTKTLFCGRGLQYFWPEWYQFVNITLHTVVCFWLSTPKGFVKAHTEHVRGIKTALLTPTRYNEGRSQPLFYGAVASVHVRVKYFWSSQRLGFAVSLSSTKVGTFTSSILFVYPSAVIFFSFALVKLLTANTVNAATLIVLQTQTRTSYVAVRFTIIWRNKRR